MPAYAYLRKSSSRDPAQDLSPAAQEAAVRAMAERHGDGGRLVVLSDMDLSGRLGRDKRPGYDQLLRAIESGRCTAVYSYSLSRLGRSVAELARLVGDCVARGVPVRLHADAVDTSTASGMLLFHVLAAVAQFEAEVASERVKAANAAKVARGGRLGATPYGEGAGEDAAAVLAAFHDAGSYSGAAARLNAAGVKPKRSPKGVWWPSSVAVVVKRLEPSSARFSSAGSRARSDFALARLLRCAACGTLLTGMRDRGGSRVRYACRLGSVTPHRRVSISEHLIMPAVRAEVERAEVALISFTAADDRAAGRRAVEERLERYRTMFGEGDIGRDRFLAERARAEAELADLPTEDELLGLNPRVGPLVDFAAEPAEINLRLRAVFNELHLDEDMTYVEAVWRNPAWRRVGSN